MLDRARDRHGPARLVFATLYGLDEHFAADAPLTPFDGPESERLGRVLQQLDRLLGGHGRLA